MNYFRIISGNLTHKKLKRVRRFPRFGTAKISKELKTMTLLRPDMNFEFLKYCEKFLERILKFSIII